MKHIILFILFLIAGTLTSTAQNAELDSLIMIERDYVGDDTKHLKLLAKIINRIIPLDNEKCIVYCRKAIRISDVVGDLKRKAQVQSFLGTCYFHTGNIDSAFILLENSLATSQLAGDSLTIGNALSNIGSLNKYLYNAKAAADYFQKAIMIYERINQHQFFLQTSMNLGNLYRINNDYREAQSCLLKALEIAKQDDRKDFIIEIYTELGNIYGSLAVDSDNPGDIETALNYYELALSEVGPGLENKKPVIILSIGNTYNMKGLDVKALEYYFEVLKVLSLHEQISPNTKYHLSCCYTNIAEIINDMCDSTFQRLYNAGFFSQLDTKETSQYKISLYCLENSITFQEAIHRYAERPASIILQAEAFMNLNNAHKAINLLHEAYSLADSLNLIQQKGNAAEVLSNMYESLGRYDSAYYAYKDYISIHDSIDNKSIRDQLARKEAEYEFSIKEKDLLHQKELSDVAAASANTELQRQLLLTRTREQEILLKDRALEIGQKEKEMQHLAYLKKMAELDIVKLEKQDKDKQLSLTKQSFALQNLKLSKRELERNLLIVGVALSLLSIFLIFRNYRNQRKANLKQQELNAMISEANQELNGKNTELASTLDNLRTTQAQLVETEKQKENEVIRRRISQDIHDDISSGLTRIAWLSELAKEKAARGEQQEAGNALEKILASSRETVDRLGEIIWAINPDRDNLEGFFAYLRTYIVKFFEDTTFKVTLDFPEKKPDLKFNPDLKRTLFLVVKEALHNVAKHSKADQVAVAFHCPDHRYSITITDDGKGFDVAATQLKGNGLKNMQKRMESVGGEIEIESQPEQGTVVSLSGEVYN